MERIRSDKQHEKIVTVAYFKRDPVYSSCKHKRCFGGCSKKKNERIYWSHISRR